MTARYAHPGAGTISLALDRLKAAHPTTPGRSLIFNPGGPGGSGTFFVYFESLGNHGFSSGVRENYDLIGLDQRGGGSATTPGVTRRSSTNWSRSSLS